MITTILECNQHKIALQNLKTVYPIHWTSFHSKCFKQFFYNYKTRVVNCLLFTAVIRIGCKADPGPGSASVSIRNHKTEKYSNGSEFLGNLTFCPCRSGLTTSLLTTRATTGSFRLQKVENQGDSIITRYCVWGIPVKVGKKVGCHPPPHVPEERLRVHGPPPVTHTGLGPRLRHFKISKILFMK